MRIFLFLKILYLNFKDKEWYICYEVNNTFLNLLKVSWYDSKEAVEEHNYRKKCKSKSEIETDMENKIICSIRTAVFVCTGNKDYDMLTNDILKNLIGDEKFFQDEFGDILKKCVDSKEFGFSTEMEILEKVGCFIAFNYSNGIDLNYMISRKNEYFEKRMRHIIKSACDELFLNNKKENYDKQI